MIEVTAHGKKRIRQRCGIKLKSVDRMAEIAYTRGITHSESTGELKKYIDSLYFYNGQANNVRLHGDKVYIFCNDILVTVFNIPKKYQNIVNKIARRRSKVENTK